MKKKIKSTSHVKKPMDGKDLIEAVEEQQQQDNNNNKLLDNNNNKSSLGELQSSAESDRVSKEFLVLTESTSGQQDKTRKTECKEALSEFRKAMASGLKQDPVVILRMDGDDLQEFVKSPTFEPDMLSIFSQIELTNGSLKDFMIKAFEKLTVDQGMPPAMDISVRRNIVEPALDSLGGSLQKPVSQETFLVEFKRAAENVVQILREQPAIVAHSQHTFDGSGIRRHISTKFELDTMLDLALSSVPKDQNGGISKEHMTVALNSLASSVGLPLTGVVDQTDLCNLTSQMDSVMAEVLRKKGPADGKMMNEDEFKDLLMELIRGIMVQLEGKPVSMSINTIVHDPLASSSTLQK